MLFGSACTVLVMNNAYNADRLPVVAVLFDELAGGIFLLHQKFFLVTPDRFRLHIFFFFHRKKARLTRWLC